MVSVDDIPDNGGGLETWTTEFAGDVDANLAAAGASYDLVVVDNQIGLFNSSGTISIIQYDAGNWVTTPAAEVDVMDENSSFKGSLVVDMEQQWQYRCYCRQLVQQ